MNQASSDFRNSNFHPFENRNKSVSNVILNPKELTVKSHAGVFIENNLKTRLNYLLVVAFKWILVVDATNDLVKMFVKCCNLKRFIHDMLPLVKPPGQGAGFL